MLAGTSPVRVAQKMLEVPSLLGKYIMGLLALCSATAYSQHPLHAHPPPRTGYLAGMHGTLRCLKHGGGVPAS